MADQIIITDIIVEAILGINPAERTTPQPIVVNVALSVDTRPAAASDRIDEAINYSQVTNRVIDVASQGGYFLIERLAHEIARVILDEFAGVENVRVRVEKPQALTGRARNVGVEIERQRTKSINN